jgi:hypothetical protein
MPNRPIAKSVAEARLRKAGFSPLHRYPGSNKKWQARCRKCSEVSEKTLFQYESFPCKFCSGKRLPKSATERLAKLAGFQLLEPFKNTRTKTLARHLACGREMKVSWAALREGGGCASCAGRKITVQDAHNRASELGLIPLGSYVSSRAKWRLQCRTCLRLLSLDSASVLKGHGCAYCSGVRVDESDAVSRMLAAELKPLVPYPGSKTPWLCSCLKCGEIVSPRRDSILAGQQGCLYCSGRKWRNSEAVQVFKASNLEPREEYPGFSEPWKSLCLVCKRTVSPTLGTVLNGGGCRFCAGRATDPVEAVEIMRKNGLEPEALFPGVNRAWKSRCRKCSKIVSPQFGKVRSGEVSGCAYCSRKRISAPDAVRVMNSAGLVPLEEYPGVHSPWKSRCVKCEKVVSPYFVSIQRGSGCRFCAPYGIDLKKPAILYWITHPELKASKIGIGQASSDRIEIHLSYGWNLVRIWSYPNGELAAAAEVAVLRYFRKTLGLPPFLRATDMPQGGFTETISAAAVSIETISELLSGEGLIAETSDST